MIGSRENDIQQKSLSNVSETKHDHMLIGKFPQKVDRSGIARFFPVKSFSKKDSTFNYFFKKIQNKGKGL